MPVSIEILTARIMRRSIRGKVGLAKARGSTTHSTGEALPIRIRPPLKNTTGQDRSKAYRTGRPTEGRRARVRQARVGPASQHSQRAAAAEEERRIVAYRRALLELEAVAAHKAPRRWKVEEGRVPLEARKEAAAREWRAVVGRQAAAACPPDNPCKEVVVVSREVVPEAVVSAAAAAAVAVAEDDKEVRICIHIYI